jgi:multiple sugar transport system ATP-binding protein
MGSPSMNLVDATVGGDHVTFAGFSLPLRSGSPLAGEERKVVLGIRPTDFKHEADAPAVLPRITVRADVIEELGGVSNLLFVLDAPRVVTDSTRAAAEAGSDDEGTLLADDQRARFCACVDGRRAVSVGEAVELAVDNEHFHFFDADTGTVLAGPTGTA